MNIRLHVLSSSLAKNDPATMEDAKTYIDELNSLLFDQDLALAENAPDALFDVVFIASGGAEQEFLSLFPTLESPVILLTHSKNNSLPAAFEIATYIHRQGGEAWIFTEGEERTAEILKDISKIYLTYHKMMGSNLGIIGEPSDWLIASKVDKEKVESLFHIHLVSVPMEEFREEIDRHELVHIPHEATLRKKAKNLHDLEESFSIYSALKRLVKKYHLNGLTVRCFDLLGIYHETSCLALALLNEEGITAGCEGDVPSLLTMYLVYLISGHNPFMANPSRISLENNTILLAHCTCPVNMLSSYQLTTHFESGAGIAIEGEFSLLPVEIVKIQPDLKEVFVLQGTVKESPHLAGYCRSQILVKVEENTLYSLFSSPFGNHLIVTYDQVSDTLVTLLEFLSRLKTPQKTDN